MKKNDIYLGQIDLVCIKIYSKKYNKALTKMKNKESF